MAAVGLAAGISEHPDPALATGEVLGQIMEQLGETPDLVTLFLSSHHIPVATEIATSTVAMLQPTSLIGASASSIIGDAREIEAGPALAAFAASNIGPLDVAHIEAVAGDEGTAVTGLDDIRDGTLLLLADPFSFPVEGFLRSVNATPAALTVVGGLASAAAQPGGNVLLRDDQVHRSGAVGIVLPSGLVTTVVSHGCRPFGTPFIVTAASSDRISELGGQPATQRLRQMAASLGDEDRALIPIGLQIGLVTDESHLDPAPGEFLILAVTDVDPASGTIGVAAPVEVGSSVQFQLRNEVSADEDLRRVLREVRADAALLFTSVDRGSHMFDCAHHDANLLAGAVDAGPLAGMFCAGEIGPIGSASHLHRSSATAALFRS